LSAERFGAPALARAFNATDNASAYGQFAISALAKL
jgi:hypothetical protein